MRNLYILILVSFTFYTAQSQIVDIPDANFKQALLNASLSNATARDINYQSMIIDSNNDNEIQISEALQVYYLSVSNKNIDDLTGIEEFVSLGTLYCGNNNLTEINLSTLNNLENLGVRNNQLSALDLSNVVLLDNLSCSSNNLSVLDVSGLPELETFLCSANNLSSLDLSNNTELSVFKCGNNQLTTLDLSGLSNLELLWFNDNAISDIDFSETPKVNNLNCENNNFIELDTSTLTGLYVLKANGNANLVSMNIKNLVIPTGGNLEFNDCPSLQYICGDAEDIIAIENKIDFYAYTNCYTNTLCAFVEDAPYFRIEGQVIFDENGNGCDDDDVFRPEYLVISDGSNTGDILADELGNYHMNVQANTYEIMPFFPNGDYFSISPPMAVVNFPAQGSPFVQDFCVTSGGNFTDLAIEFREQDIIFYAEEGSVLLDFSNNGSVTRSGTITLTYDDELGTFVEASEDISSQSTNTLMWDFQDLQPFETRSIEVTFDMNGPSDTPPINEGDIISYATEIMSSSTDETPVNNIDTIDLIGTENVLGIEVFEFADFFKLYPNPAVSEIHIQSKKNIQVKGVEVYNLIGQKVISKTLSESSFALNIDDLTIGLYIIRLETEQGMLQSKFIKN